MGLRSVEVLLHLAAHGPLDGPQLMELAGMENTGCLTTAVRPLLPWWEPSQERERLPRLPLLMRKRKPGQRIAYRYFLTDQARQLLARCGIDC